MITADDFIGTTELENRGEMVRRVIEKACQTPEKRVLFFGRYAQWNGLFGGGVAGLSGKIVRMRKLFMDPSEPLVVAQDRSVLVASYIFDASRDEFNDSSTKNHRDTHRDLGQAHMKGLLQCEGEDHPRWNDPSFVNEFLKAPLWLDVLCENVGKGYGAHTPDDAWSTFASMGFHVGSELLADQEFSTIDKTMREQCASLVSKMQNLLVDVAKVKHKAYAWLSIHSGYGGGVEADHFEWATRGIRLGLELTPSEYHEQRMQALRAGFAQFDQDHHTFFTEVEKELDALV